MLPGKSVARTIRSSFVSLLPRMPTFCPPSGGLFYAINRALQKEKVNII
nr:MAG TPA: hypothetical protein [Caudoviricetes sp.]DAN09548.1 MAG TPA: hypothetical protein [Caudoviricetes sp.]DAW00297.1 MAG TPA: hypothetical protein [Caudoviricetes sp.]